MCNMRSESCLQFPAHFRADEGKVTHGVLHVSLIGASHRGKNGPKKWLLSLSLRDRDMSVWQNYLR